MWDGGSHESFSLSNTYLQTEAQNYFAIHIWIHTAAHLVLLRFYSKHMNKSSTCYSAYMQGHMPCVHTGTRVQANPDSVLFFLWRHLSLALSTYFMPHYPTWQQTRRRKGGLREATRWSEAVKRRLVSLLTACLPLHPLSFLLPSYLYPHVSF